MIIQTAKKIINYIEDNLGGNMEKITTVLFDLDGTLIPFDQKEFIESYLYLIAKKFVPRGYDKDILIKALWDGTGNMVKNDGKVSNRDVFKSTFAELMEKEYDEMEDDFMEFYEKEFDDVKQTLQEEVDRAEFIKTIKDKGLKVVLATNPIFPKAAVQTRLNGLVLVWTILIMLQLLKIATIANLT